MKYIKVCLVSLGCEKNLVDSEIILGMLSKSNFVITPQKRGADIIIVNTCGFIESAKKEAIEEIFDAIEYKKYGTKIIVTGCLVERYLEDLKQEIPEVDLFVPIREYYKFNELMEGLLKDSKYHDLCFDPMNRMISTPPHLAYVRISEGCNNCCAYCAIPLIRGRFVSRREEDILDEVKMLVKEGRSEICLISQDVTRYGTDTDYTNLAILLDKICKIEGDFKVRLLYLYPDEITEEIIQAVKRNEKVMHYFDIPLQHISTSLLKAMNRRGNKSYVRDLINHLRDEIPDVVIRTTIIVGFPGETEEDHKELLEFVKEMEFNHLGAFTFSREEGTKAFDLPFQIEEDVKNRRYSELMEVQKNISLKKNEEFIGKIYDVVLEEYDGEFYIGRGYMLAPDDIDGAIYVKAKSNKELYKTYKVKIIDAEFYDLIGEIDE